MAIVVFLTTGRCGTQFATALLARACGERAEVVHEPIRAAYAPRLTLRSDRLDEHLVQMPAVRKHFDHIDHIVHGQGRTYIETGWPIFSWLPLLKRRYADDLVIVHVVREPLRFAFSMATHGFYTPEERQDDYARLGVVQPSDPGVRFGEYAMFWGQLNVVEKCLFFWLEVNTYAEELKRELGGRWITLRSRDLFGDPTGVLEKLRAAHPGLATTIDAGVRLNETVDRFRYPLRQSIDAIRIPPDVVALARHYGFERPADFDALQRRFVACSA